MSGLPQSYGVQFPSAGGNAYPPSASTYAATALPQHQAQQVAIQPGSITYTTTTLPDGRIQYNQFRAEARSYQTPQGPVHGIQWVPVNISYEIPVNAQPAGPDFHAAWSRSNHDKDSHKSLKEWQRDQEKRARKEEKEAAKRMKEWERDRRDREKAEEKELRRAQERDLLERGRERKLSHMGTAGDYHSSTSAAYTRARSRSRARRHSAGEDELTRAMAEMAMDKEWAASEGEGRYRERRGSNVGRPRKMSINERVRGGPVSDYESSRKAAGGTYGDYERTRRTSGTPYPAPGYATGGTTASYYGAPPSPGRGAYSGRTSPYMGDGGLPPTGPVYPPGHIYAGKPIPGMQGENLGTMQVSHESSSPRRSAVPLSSSAPLDSPAGFSRRPSLAVPYTDFDPLLILTDLNDLYQRLPLMPAVLGPHDVWVEDWIRCVEDMARAWTGQMPLREHQRSLKNYHMVAQLIDVWNASFFSLRGVELVLYRGRRRYSGPHAGRYDNRLGLEGESEEESDTISSVSSDSDAEERYAFYGGGHSRHGNHWLADSREARHERKAEKRRLREKRRNRRERERATEMGLGFRLYLMCINEGQSRLPSNNAGYVPPMRARTPSNAGYGVSMHEGHHRPRTPSNAGYAASAHEGHHRARTPSNAGYAPPISGYPGF